MKQNICSGVYGWRHSHWLDTFYPSELPVAGDEDWRLSFYSNVFNTVLVPANYWRSANGQAPVALDSLHWLDDVHDEFQFFVECQAGMFGYISLPEFIASMEKLKPQLSGLVFLDSKPPASGPEKAQFHTLMDTLAVDVYGASAALGADFSAQSKAIWRPHDPQASNFAFIESDLRDLKTARMIVDRFVSCFAQLPAAVTEASIIVKHPQLQADSMARFRSLLEIMGF